MTEFGAGMPFLLWQASCLRRFVEPVVARILSFRSLARESEFGYVALPRLISPLSNSPRETRKLSAGGKLEKCRYHDGRPSFCLDVFASTRNGVVVIHH